MKRTQPLPFSFSYYQHLMLIVLILASGGRILGQEDYTVSEALDAAELVWSTEQTSQWRPEKSALAKVGSGLVRFVSDDEGQLALLRSEIVGPGTLEFWWKVEVFDSDDEPVFSINDRTMLSRSEDSPAIW